jgi:uncharacterized coiled-coil protein SlyX
MADDLLVNLEIEGRLDDVERRISSDLGDGRGSGNVWRQIKDLADEDTKLRTALAESISRCKDNTSHNKTLIDSITVDLADVKLKVAESGVTLQTNAKQITELFDHIEKQQRLIDGLTDRLNGKGLVQVDPYEKLVSQVRSTSEMLQGGEGQLSFPQVRNSIQQTQFLGRVLYGAIGLFGVGAVSAAGLTLFGGEKIAPEVKALQEANVRLTADVTKLRDEFSADLRKRLEEATNRK